jgi:hypothetical protein
MRDTPRIDTIRYAPASAIMRATGLMGWAMCRLDGQWELDGFAVRRTGTGRYVLTFPSRIDGSGIERTSFRPLDEEARATIEATVLAHVRAGGWIT